MQKIKIILADDHLIVRNGIKMLLDAQPNFEVIADVGSGKEVLDLLNNGVEVEMLVTDLNMENIDGIKLLKEISTMNLPLKTAVLTMLGGDEYVVNSFRYGARGFFVKNVASEELIYGFNLVAKGRRYLCEEITMRWLDKMIGKNDVPRSRINPAQLDLSPREMEVLALLGDGYTNQEISDKLFLSKRTVEGHRQSLIEKTKAKNTAALIKFATQHDLIQ